MTTVTRTFPVSINSTSVANTVTEICHFRDMAFADDDLVAIYLESVPASVNLFSFRQQRFPDYDGSESDAEKVNKFTSAQNLSQKMGLRFVARKNNTGNWRKLCEITLLNAGREQYLDFCPRFFTQKEVRILEKNDAIGYQLIDYGNGLLKNSDLIELEFQIRIEITKKNDEDIPNRLAAIESLLAVYGAPSASLPGTNGLVPA